MEPVSNIWPVFTYAAVIAMLLACMLGLSAITGTRRRGAARGRAMSMPFESGIRPTGSAHLRLPVQYYLLAMFFVIFDVETAILLTWATVVTETGWIGYGAAVLFTVFLAISLAYLWRAGALDWGPRPRLIVPRPIAHDGKDRAP
ncbi:NADH-quinone oxidoreductase subunit A [Komagataeibacter oboediens]|uniref:NADH-quinone oxidoreductase subunit A n=1 Tax=Komagataeibacter xylinus NBRC 13693 TaxID=1234668 RepID=A0A0D6Q9S3_KOMXY|nr:MULTISPECIES: NADH-quinone oxidoreductase subunit A [Komagataeibacter]MBV1824547.1 NADH-quinone oxidoreductase subunit A [Komagataeibacter oboediens]WEQ51154.1 NADH-quinone oxidoreductase subunit A [Komagataeibacter oboediens]GAO00084.1 NADH-quinone oxidoreductase subunit A/NADH-ubiquinone/plastoquinone oxidoreductase subunit 3 [Komagataeibacter xylinus NBRC 13693]